MTSNPLPVSFICTMSPRKMRIMAAGPVEVPDEVRAAGSYQVQHHRTEAFRTALKESISGMQRIMRTSGPVLVLASSGTGAMESCVANLFSPEDEVLVTVCGHFTQRWVDICETFGLTVHRIHFEWGEPVDPKQLEAKLNRHPAVKGVFTVLNETSTGVANNIEEIAKVVRKTSAILVVDGISGIGALPFEMDKWGVDVAVVGSQKALMLAPGLSFVALSEKARKMIPGSRIPKFYFSFTKALKSLESGPIPDTPFTPAVSLIVQLRESIKVIEAEGLENAWARGARMGAAMRAAVRALGLKLLASKGYSDVVTAVDCTDGPNASEVAKRMRDDYGISIIGGQGKLKGKMFRLGHVGNVDEVDVLACVAALEMVLKKMGHPVTLGAGVAAAEASILGGK